MKVRTAVGHLESWKSRKYCPSPLPPPRRQVSRAPTPPVLGERHATCMVSHHPQSLTPLTAMVCGYPAAACPQQTPPMPTFKRSQWRCSADLGSVTPSARFVTRSEGHLQLPRPIWVLGHLPPIRSAATARPPAGATWCAAPNARAAALLKRTPEPPPADASPSSAAHRSSLSRRRCPLM